MNLNRILAAIAMVIIGAGQLAAQNHLEEDKMTKREAEKLVPRPSFRPIKSLEGVNGIDTLDTSTPGVKIILFANNTWGFWRDPASAYTKELFSNSWTNSSVDAYGKSLSELPDRITLMLADSLSGYACPKQVKVYSPFGYRHRRRHQGVDLPLHVGDPVYAAFPGKVRISSWVHGYGNLVVIRHPNGLETFYGHLSKREVSEDQWVDAGELIGLGGSTGRSTGPHLHFETRFQGYAFDPQWVIDFESGNLRSQLFVLKKKYLSPSSKYVPESDEEEDDINEGDAKDYEKAKADSVAAAKAAAEAAAAKYYTIRQGDTLGAIAARNHTTVNRICSLNKGLKPTTVLQLGRKIRIK